MSIIVHLTPVDEARLLHEATRNGIAPEELARKLVSEHLPAEEHGLDPIEKMRQRIGEWRRQDGTPTAPPPRPHPGLTPTAALFQQWADEDALMTDEEIAADERLSRDYQHGIDEERKKAGMRTLF